MCLHQENFNTVSFEVNCLVNAMQLQLGLVPSVTRYLSPLSPWTCWEVYHSGPPYNFRNNTWNSHSLQRFPGATGFEIILMSSVMARCFFSNQTFVEGSTGIHFAVSEKTEVTSSLLWLLAIPDDEPTSGLWESFASMHPPPKRAFEERMVGERRSSKGNFLFALPCSFLDWESGMSSIWKSSSSDTTTTWSSDTLTGDRNLELLTRTPWCTRSCFPCKCTTQDLGTSTSQDVLQSFYKSFAIILKLFEETCMIWKMAEHISRCALATQGNMWFCNFEYNLWTQRSTQIENNGCSQRHLCHSKFPPGSVNSFSKANLNTGSGERTSNLLHSSTPVNKPTLHLHS